MAGRPIFALISLILLAAAVLFQFFVVLSGGTEGSPEPHFYFLRANTGPHITTSPFPTVAWTFFALCSYSNGRVTFCQKAKAALPFSPEQNFHTTTGVPAAFIGSHHYYYLSRFMFAFYLIALFFACLALLTGLLALCTRVGAFLSGALTGCAVFFQALAASLMTAWTIQGRNAFRSAGIPSNLGTYSYGFTWGAFAALFLSMILFCVAGGSGGSSRKETSYEKKSRFGGFGRKRSTRSREGVKDDYS